MEKARWSYEYLHGIFFGSAGEAIMTPPEAWQQIVEFLAGNTAEISIWARV